MVRLLCCFLKLTKPQVFGDRLFNPRGHTIPEYTFKLDEITLVYQQSVVQLNHANKWQTEMKGLSNAEMLQLGKYKTQLNMSVLTDQST